MALLQVTDERPDAEIDKLLRAVIASAAQEFSPLRYEGEYPDSGFGIQPIRPRHVGIDVRMWQMTVTTAYANWISTTLGTDNFVVPTGVFNLTVDPSTTELQATANGKDLPVMNIEALYANAQLASGWFTKPFAVRPSNAIRIQAVGRVAQTERLGLLGYNVAKRSYLINQTAT